MQGATRLAAVASAGRKGVIDRAARGIVRGRWEISNYDVNERIAPETMLLPRWSSAPRDSLRAHRFEGRVVDALPPEIQVASSEEVVRARVQAESAVRAAMLARPATVSVTGRGISDLVRITRAEGVAVGVGAICHVVGECLAYLGLGRDEFPFVEREEFLIAGRLGGHPVTQPTIAAFLAQLGHGTGAT